MAIPYSVPGYPQQTGFGAALALVPTRPLVPMAPNSAMHPPATYHPGISPVFDPHAFLPPVKPGDFEVQSLISIPDLIRYVRQRWRIATFLGLILAAGVFYVLGMGAKIYQSESQLLLNIKGDNPFDFEGFKGSVVSDLSAPQLVNNHRSELSSRRYMEYFAAHYDQGIVKRLAERQASNLGRKDQLLKLIGLYKPGTMGDPKEIFIEYLSGAVAVEPLKETHILRVQVRDLEPETAAHIANHFVELYLTYVADNEAETSRSQSEYLATESSEALKRLREAEQKIAAYRTAHHIIDDTDSQNVSTERVRQINTALTDARVRLSRAETDAQTLSAALQSGHSLLDVKLVADNATVAENRKQLDARRSQRASLTQLGRRHPTMVALDSEIASLEEALSKAVKSVVFMIQEDVKTHQRQVEDLNAQLSAAQGNAADLGSRNVEYSQLREDVRTHREWYDKIETRRAAASLTSKFRDSGLLRVADRAVPAGKPVKPSKPLAAVAATMVFGLTLIVLPIGWGFYDDHVSKLLSGKGAATPAEEEEMMAARVSPYSYGTAPQPLTRPFMAPEPQAPPPTGYLPSPFSTAPMRPQQPPARPVMDPSPFTAVPPQAAAPQPAPQPASTSHLRPAERDLTTIARLPYVHANAPEAILAQLLKPEPLGASGALHHLTGTIERQAANRAGTGGIILITSAEAREGKTLVASTLAAALCHQGRSVFMMECNPSSPTLHQWFPRSRGFEAWANDLESLRYSHTNLFLLPGRDLPAHATNELLDGYRTWIDRAKPHVDWIILDASPLLKSFANVAPLAPLATDVILVSNPSISAPAKIRAAIALLQPMMSSSALRGMVLNGV